MNVPAYEIGAVFFLVVLVMAGTMTRGLMPRGEKSQVVLVVLIGGFFVYQSMPPLATIFDFSRAGSTQAPTKPAPVEPTAVKPKSPPRTETRVREVQVVQPPPAPEPQPVEIITPPEAQPAAEDKGVKHAVKSVGKFLHIGRKKTDHE